MDEEVEVFGATNRFVLKQADDGTPISEAAATPGFPRQRSEAGEISMPGYVASLIIRSEMTSDFWVQLNQVLTAAMVRVASASSYSQS